MYIALRSSNKRPLTSASHTVVGPNLIRIDVLEPTSESHIRRRDLRDLYSASYYTPTISGKIMLHLKVGEARPRVVVDVVE